MAFVKEGLPDLLLHLDSEGNVLDGEGSEVAFDKPLTGRPTDHSSIYINSSNSQNEGVCVGLK